jgi:hypothetical protein
MRNTASFGGIPHVAAYSFGMLAQFSFVIYQRRKLSKFFRV